MNDMHPILEELEHKADYFKENLDRLAAVDTTGLISIWKYLRASEALMVDVFDAENAGKIPDVGGRPGELEYGPMLYMLNNLPDELAWVTKVLKKLGMPNTGISPQQWGNYVDRLKGEGYFGGDGTLLQGDGSAAYFHKYIQLDPGWAFSAFEYIAYLIDLLGKFKRAEFKITPRVTTISDKEYSELAIAIVGDWGTGIWKDGNQPDCPSQRVMEQLVGKQPDVIIHLGDVYYAGNYGIGRGETGEEYKNFVKLWPTAGAKYSFAINSNHEMYGGGNGYFKVALASDIFKPTQDGTSYFAIDYGDWLILGLDSAYYDTSALYMKGALYDPNVKKSLKQQQFIKDCAESAKAKGQRLIVLTHHNPLLTSGALPTDEKDRVLWNQLTSNLGYPEYWYWGHVHNGIVYTDKSGAGKNTKCRCVGHGSIPFANGYELEQARKNGVVDYYAHTLMTGSSQYPLTESQKLRVDNGFAVIKLKGKANHEAFYETGNPTAVWTSGA